MTTSRTAYTAASVPRVVASLLGSTDLRSATETAPKAPTPHAPAVQDSSPAYQSQAVGPLPAGCLQALAAGGGRTPVLVDSGTWQGRPARLVVLRWAEDPHRGDAYVVEPTCDATHDRTLFYAGVRLP